jgi:hypothetical protein
MGLAQSVATSRWFSRFLRRAGGLAGWRVSRLGPRVALATFWFTAQLVAHLAAQTEWVVRGWTGRTSHSLAYDGARGRVVLFGGGNGSSLADTWEWDGSTWTERTPAVSPVARYGHALAYDSARRRIVLFGGCNDSQPSPYFSDTWEWDGGTWTQRSPAVSPPPRHGHGLAYDQARGKVVLFGGYNPSLGSFLSDTWEWDGSAWTQGAPGFGPVGRTGHALAYDGARSRVVLFGGLRSPFPSPTYLADTWEWDGSTWTQRAPPARPAARSGHALAYQSARGRIVLFGGSDALGPIRDTWEWDGTTWTNRAPALSPSARSSHAMAYDSQRDRIVLAGGADRVTVITDTWEWDGNAWSQWVPAAPPARHGHALVYDSLRGRVILTGGYGLFLFADTWEWDGSIWTQRNPPASPQPPRESLALAYDSARDRVVLFGGLGISVLSDTWEWDGSTWSQPQPAASPPARLGHALAYDSARGKVLLFGGSTNMNPPFLADTWEWDGATWTPRTPAVSPPARYRHALAYDSARGRVVLFGGNNGAVLADTWEWDGNTWTQQTPTTSPSARAGHALAHDSARGRVVLFAGNNGTFGANLADTWEWDGTTWTQRTPVVQPPARTEHALAYDAARGRAVLFGGGNVPLSDTWEYGPTHAASYQPFGNGCAGSAGVPRLEATRLPWLGDSVRIQLTQLPANTAALLSVGISRTAWGPVPLPLPLDALGMTGCTLYVSGNVILSVVIVAGAGSVTIGVPNDQSLLGASFFNEGFVLDPPANAAGITTSNAGEARIGAR